MHILLGNGPQSTGRILVIRPACLLERHLEFVGCIGCHTEMNREFFLIHYAHGFTAPLALSMQAGRIENTNDELLMDTVYTYSIQGSALNPAPGERDCLTDEKIAFQACKKQGELSIFPGGCQPA